MVLSGYLHSCSSRFSIQSWFADIRQLIHNSSICNSRVESYKSSTEIAWTSLIGTAILRILAYACWPRIPWLLVPSIIVRISGLIGPPRIRSGSALCSSSVVVVCSQIVVNIHLYYMKIVACSKSDSTRWL